MGQSRSFFLFATTGVASLALLMASASASLANPPTHGAPAPRIQHPPVVRNAPARIVNSPRGRGVVIHRKAEIVRRKPIARHERELPREVVIERRETPVRHETIVAPATLVRVVQDDNFRDAYPSKHPHFSAALTALVAAHEDLQRTAAPGDISAISALKTAQAELDAASASTKYHARRSDAMELTSHAIRELEGAANGNPDELAQQAIQDVRYCIYMADHPGVE